MGSRGAKSSPQTWVGGREQRAERPGIPRFRVATQPPRENRMTAAEAAWAIGARPASAFAVARPRRNNHSTAGNLMARAKAHETARLKTRRPPLSWRESGDAATSLLDVLVQVEGAIDHDHPDHCDGNNPCNQCRHGFLLAPVILLLANQNNPRTFHTKANAGPTSWEAIKTARERR
jgi:hypothetical protein